MSLWDNQEILARWEQARAKKRESGRLTFDCLNLRCQEDRAYCSKGKLLRLTRDKAMALIAVLRGETSGTCRNCEDFTTEVE